MNPLVMMFTESDNRTHDIFRYLALATILTAIGLQIFVVVMKGQTFDVQQFGIGSGALFAGMGAALMMKPNNTNTTTAPASGQPTGVGQIP
jgi:ATP-dependent protease HslVU (ClpYQ) peptidase subunit